MDSSKRTKELPMTVYKPKSTVYLLPKVAWPIIKQNIANTLRSLIILIIPYFFTQGGAVAGLSSPGSGPGWGHCVVFLGKTLYSHGASLHPGV